MPITRYGEASHLVMVDVDGAVQVSKARPAPTMPVTAAEVAALEDDAVLEDDVALDEDAEADVADVADVADLAAVAVAADLAAVADAPTVSAWPPAGLAVAADVPDAPEPDTWALCWRSSPRPGSSAARARSGRTRP